MCNKYLIRNPLKMIWWHNSQHLFFQCPAGKKNMGFFSQWSHFSGIIDVRHFVGFLFRRYGKKQFSRQFTFLKFVLESLQGTELVTWHISWTFPSSIWCWPTNHRTGFRVLGHVTSSVPFKNSSGFFEVSFVCKCLCQIFMYSTWWQFSCKCWV